MKVAEDSLGQTTIAHGTVSVSCTDVTPPPPCWVCAGAPIDAPAGSRYVYLLGQHLGDGHLVTSARVPVLRIYACTDYPTIVGEIDCAVVYNEFTKSHDFSQAHYRIRTLAELKDIILGSS